MPWSIVQYFATWITIAALAAWLFWPQARR